MNREDLIDTILDSNILKNWHWFSYHFNPYFFGFEHNLAKSIVDACISVEAKIPGFANKFINDIASLSGIEKHLPHYEQLLQRLAELYVINKAVEFDWEEGTVFHLEPTIGSSKKNPEINIETPKFIIGIEVKAPSLVDHINTRSVNPFQLSGRDKSIFEYTKTVYDDFTLPRDNPVKDFLISANEKFASFKELSEKPFYSSLFIVWDDYIYEPITALNYPSSGLLTENSFYKNKDGQAFKFQNIDAIVLLRHLHILMRATKDEPLIDASHALDYTPREYFPPKVFIPVNNQDNIPLDFINAFHLRPLDEMMGAEYHPSDGIMWVKVPNRNKKD